MDQLSYPESLSPHLATGHVHPLNMRQDIAKFSACLQYFELAL